MTLVAVEKLTISVQVAHAEAPEQQPSVASAYFVVHNANSGECCSRTIATHFAQVQHKI
jgi:hypothetical protein